MKRNTQTITQARAPKDWLLYIWNTQLKPKTKAVIAKTPEPIWAHKPKIYLVILECGWKSQGKYHFQAVAWWVNLAHSKKCGSSPVGLWIHLNNNQLLEPNLISKILALVEYKLLNL